ncbi:MAG: SBBP repeat-containing protein [Thermodesulfobacteriota bacterium]
MSKPIRMIQIFFVLILLSLSISASAGEVTEEWAAQYNGTGNNNDSAHDIVVDEAGNTYVTGSTYTIGDGTEFLTLKYDPQGNLLWEAKSDGGATWWNNGNVANAITLDSQGNVYVSGLFSFVYFWPDGRAIRTTGLMTVKYDNDGNEIWKAKINEMSGYARDIQVDSFGNVYVFGNSSGDGSSSDITIAKYDSNGVEQWINHYSGNRGRGDGSGLYSGDFGYAFTLDPSGNVYVVVYVRNECQPASYACQDTDAVTLKYDTNGTLLWSSEINNSLYDSAKSIDVDSSGNVYVGGSDLVKYDAAGNVIWQHKITDTGKMLYNTVLAADGSIYATARQFAFPYTFVVVKYDSSGNEVWMEPFSLIANPYTNNCDPGDVDTDADSAFYVSGLCTGYYPYSDVYDAYTVKFDPDGSMAWYGLYSGPLDIADQLYAMTLDSSNNVYVAGQSHNGRNTGKYDFLTIKYSQATPNAEPVANAGVYQNVECTGFDGASVTLDGSGSYDADGDPLTYSWTIDTPAPTVLTGVAPAAVLPLGTWTATLVVNDGTVDSAQASVDVTVADTTAPTLTLTVSPTELIPPDKSMRLITTDAVATDICDPAVTPHVFTITSSEASTTADDIEIVGDSVSLRAERDAGGDGRIYTITFDAVDSSGNASSAPGTVTVPVQVGPPPVPPIPDNPNLPDPFPGTPGGGRP